MISLVILAAVAAFATAQHGLGNEQIIDGTVVRSPLYSSTIAPPVTSVVTVTETTGTVTHTCIVTVDEFMPMTATVLQSQYYTSTQFQKNTETDTVTNTYSTPVNPILVVRTETDTGNGAGATATDTLTDNQISTETQVEMVTLTHRTDNIVFTTTTAWLEQTQTYSKMIVQTEIEHVFVTKTVVKTVTDTRIINPATRHLLVPTPRAIVQPIVHPIVQPRVQDGGY